MSIQRNISIHRYIDCLYEIEIQILGENIGQRLTRYYAQFYLNILFLNTVFKDNIDHVCTYKLWFTANDNILSGYEWLWRRTREDFVNCMIQLLTRLNHRNFELELQNQKRYGAGVFGRGCVLCNCLVSVCVLFMLLFGRGSWTCNE